MSKSTPGRFWAALSVILAAGTAPATPAPSPQSEAAPRDCSAAYAGEHAECRPMPCGASFTPYLGHWSGEFSAYVRERSRPQQPVFRTYRDSITYSGEDCMEDLASGDTFIVGHRSDDYPEFAGLPARQESGLLVMGQHRDGTPFLRVIDEHGRSDFSLLYRNQAADLAIWNFRKPATAEAPEMSYTIIDGRDLQSEKERRSVTVTLSVGPDEQPFWRGVIAHGAHSRIEGAG